MQSVQSGSIHQQKMGVKKPTIRVGLPIKGSKYKMLDLKKLAEKFEESRKIDPNNFNATGKGTWLNECRQLLMGGIHHIRVEVIHAEEMNEKKIYYFRFVEETKFPTTMNRLCQEIFSESPQEEMV